VVGWIRIEKFIKGDTVHIQLHSEINIKFLLNFSVQIFEEASFLNGTMISSALLRKFNGNVKTNRQSTYTSQGYEVKENGQIQILNISPVSLSLLSLYFLQPINHQNVYSDSLGQYVKIENIGTNSYTINFPNGLIQNYYYQKGTLVKVNMKDNFYSADVLLVNQI
jgi:hypothetical protein